MDEPNFFKQVYAIVQKIPAGRVATYGQIAALLGTRDARRIGHALHANPSQETPCHRVVFASGALAPGYAFGGPNEQRRKLELEGVGFVDNALVDLKTHLWKP
jgi:methylated-DNA-protein-cysteine methyltransferase-like protein